MSKILSSNKIYNESCLCTMSCMADDEIDLVVTSPPYDSMRDYNGYEFDAFPIIDELCRVVKDGGAIVWIVGDSTKNFGESGSSFKQALRFVENGYGMETMIWEKPSAGGCLGSNRLYGQVFEYMFVFFNGTPHATNLIYDRKNVIKSGKVQAPCGIDSSGHPRYYREYDRTDLGKRTNIWKYAREDKNGHPAPFPLQMAKDHIQSWSNPGDLVYDPFMGSGTTAVAAIESGREYIGSEISNEYCELIKQRISNSTSPLF